MKHVPAATTLLVLNVKTTGMLCRSCGWSNLHCLPLIHLSSAAFQIHCPHYLAYTDASARRLSMATCSCRPETCQFGVSGAQAGTALVEAAFTDFIQAMAQPDQASICLPSPALHKKDNFFTRYKTQGHGPLLCNRLENMTDKC